VDPNDLYGLPLERFTQERNALAKALRQDGQRDLAANVSRLRKPSVTAWAVNQLVRTQPKDIAALFAAGDALQAVQSDLLAGRSDPGALRGAVESERAAVDRLLARARGLLSSEGHELSPSALEQVAETLHAAALDQAARTQVGEGRLERELRHIGLGALGGGASGPRAGSSPRPDRADRSRAVRAETEARRQLERAHREVRQAEERRRRAQTELEHAEELLGTARDVHDAAVRQHELAQQRLQELG
jgi:hypothetical protein